MLLNAIKKVVPFSAKMRLREWVLTQYRIPFSRFGVPPVLVGYLRGHAPVSLIDIGASSGEFTETLSKVCPLRDALLIEPIPKRCQELKSRFADRPFRIVCNAVGDKEAELQMDVLKWDYSSSILPVLRSDANVTSEIDLEVSETITTRLRPLDHICRDAGMTAPVDLLKIDVQGAEHLVLAGARETLRRVRAIWIEVSFRPLYEGAARFEAIYDQCRKAGFRLANMAEGFRGQDGELLQADALFIRDQNP
jgi:FkbM family methyltransferase